MYSATAITAAIAITALAVNVIDTTPTQPSAGAVSTHVVAADGSGGFSTIAEAVAAAAEGDTVLVRPGTYVEAIVIDKDITLAGDGDREDIVIRAPEDGPTTYYDAVGVYQFDPAYILLVDDSQAEVRGLTFAGAQAGVVVEAGSPTLTNLVFDGNEFGLLIHSGSMAKLTDSLLTVGGIEFAASEPIIEGNDLRDGAGIMDVFSTGDGTVIRDNVLTAGRIEVGGSPLIEGNTVTGPGSVGISSMNVEGPAGAPVIRNNTIRDSRSGIQVGSGGDYGGSGGSGPDAAAALPEVIGNDISAELNAISVNWTDAMISENNIHDSWNGIVLFGSGSAEITGNEIDVEWVGIDIGKDTSPSVDGNSICGGSASINIHETASPSISENATCDPA
jgi:parallel beta-helix repeat protein